MLHQPVGYYLTVSSAERGQPAGVSRGRAPLTQAAGLSPDRIPDTPTGHPDREASPGHARPLRPAGNSVGWPHFPRQTRRSAGGPTPFLPVSASHQPSPWGFLPGRLPGAAATRSPLETRSLNSQPPEVPQRLIILTLPPRPVICICSVCDSEAWSDPGLGGSQCDGEMETPVPLQPPGLLCAEELMPRPRRPQNRVREVWFFCTLLLRETMHF